MLIEVFLFLCPRSFTSRLDCFSNMGWLFPNTIFLFVVINNPIVAISDKNVIYKAFFFQLRGCLRHLTVGGVMNWDRDFSSIASVFFLSFKTMMYVQEAFSFMRRLKVEAI